MALALPRKPALGSMHPDWATAEKDQRWLASTGAILLPRTYPGYPPLLKQTPDPPIALFLRGKCHCSPNRSSPWWAAATPACEGRRNAEEFAAYLAAAAS